jgi:hypothetical protein
MHITNRFALLTFWGVLCCCITCAQTKTDVTTPPLRGKDSFAKTIDRWFDAQQLQVDTRYRFVENDTSQTISNVWQYRQSYRFRFKFDPEGNFAVNAGVFTGGTGFGGSWNNTGAGTVVSQGTSFQGTLLFKQLYFEARPMNGLEVQYGGLFINRGEGTEAITYDNDGYIVGERLSLKRPQDLFFDEISATYAYLGDLATPDVFDRLKRLNQSNYHQFLVGKRIGKRARLSADYTFQWGIETLRQSIKVDTKGLRWIDSILFENYERVDVMPDYGFNLVLGKTLAGRLTLSPGFASVDPNLGVLNGDFYARGNRVYLITRLALSPELSITAQATQALHNDFIVANHTRFDLVLSYNLMKTLQKAGVLKGSR